MSHQISIREDGTAEAMYAFQKAWHGLGTVVNQAPTSEEAIQLAQLDWAVEKWPAFAHSPEGDVVASDNTYFTVRTDTQAPLGVVTSTYQPVQNQEAFEFLDALVQDGIIKYEAAGALHGGSRIWLLARMPKEFVLGDSDAVEPYILFANSHDGSMAVRIMPTAVRVVCNNTLTMALGQRKGDRQLHISHKGNIQRKVEDARKLLNLANSKFEMYMQQAQGLANTSLDQKTFNEYLETLYPDPLDENGNKKKTKRAQNVRNAIRNTMEHKTNQIATAKGTWWGAFNSVTEYIDHQMTVKNSNDHPDRKMQSLLFDHGAKVKQKALETALDMAGVDSDN